MPMQNQKPKTGPSWWSRLCPVVTKRDLDEAKLEILAALRTERDVAGLAKTLTTATDTLAAAVKANTPEMKG